MLTQSRLKEVLSYDTASGKFTWKLSPRKDLIGKEAGYVRYDGYRQIKIDGVMYYAHRLVCLYITGNFPAISWDHKDRDRDNNKLSNFREATLNNQQHNKSIPINNTSGYKGISIIRDSGYCGVRASIRFNGRNYYKQVSLSGKVKEEVIKDLLIWLDSKRANLHIEFACN